MNKIKNGKKSLEDVNNKQEKFKSYLGEIKKATKKHRSKEQKTLYTILKRFTKQEAKLLNFKMTIL